MWTLPFQGIEIYTPDGKRMMNSIFLDGKWQSWRLSNGEKAYKSCSGLGILYVDSLGRLLPRANGYRFLPKQKKEKRWRKICGKADCKSIITDQEIKQFTNQFREDEVSIDSICGCHFHRKFVNE